MRKFFGFLALIAAMLITLNAARAGDDAGAKGKKKGKGFGGDPEAVFKKLDTNNDGKLSKDEFLKIADKAKDTEKAAKLRQRLEKAWTKLSVDNAMTLDQFKQFAELRNKKKKSADNP